MPILQQLSYPEFTLNTTDSNHLLPTVPNLLGRQFTVTQPNKVSITEITYIRTKEGWLYLCMMRLTMPWLFKLIERVS